LKSNYLFDNTDDLAGFWLSGVSAGSLRQEVLRKAFFETFGHSRKNRKIARRFYKLLKLAA